MNRKKYVKSIKMVTDYLARRVVQHKRGQIEDPHSPGECFLGNTVVVVEQAAWAGLDGGQDALDREGRVNWLES